METLKALTLEDSHFFIEFNDCTIDVDAVKIILLWNEGPADASLTEKYMYLCKALSQHFNVDFDLSNTYLVLEKACAIMATLKKTFLGSHSLKSSASKLPDVPTQN